MSFRIIDFYRKTEIVNLYNSYTTLLKNALNNQLLETQKGNLANLLAQLKTNNYYSPYLEKLSYSDIEKKPYEALNLLPIMDKDTVTKNFDNIKNDKFRFEKAFTGGSTGAPFHYLIDKKSISETRAFSYALWHHFLGYNLGDRVIVAAGTSLGKSDSAKQKVYNKLQNKHFVSNTDRGINEAHMLAELINSSKNFCYIYAYPSTLINHINIISELNIATDKSKVKGVICTSEMLFENQKHAIAQFFDTNVLNMYGANDGGIASGSTDNKKFIYNGLGCYAENITIEKQNEIVLTNLSSFAFPIVRYRVGDIGEIITESDGYPFIIRNLEGRTRDLIYIDKHQRVHGSEFNKIFKNYPAIIEYQIEQFSDHTCVIKLGCIDSAFSPEKLVEISGKIKDLLGSTPFHIEKMKNLKIKTNGKHKNIISHVG